MNILIVDDHAMATNFYETSLTEVFATVDQLKISKAINCKEAYHLIIEHAQGSDFDLAVLDFMLPSYDEQKVYNGADVGKLLRKYHPGCKIVLITAITQTLLIYDLWKTLHPDAFAIKCDIGVEDIMQIVRKIFNDGHFQSVTVKKSTMKIYNEKILVDDHNRQIIFNLAKGYKVKDLASIVCLPPSTIQKRILNMKSALGISSDKSLLIELNDKGFL